MLYPAQFEETESNDVWYDDDGGETYMEFSDGFVVTFRDVPEAITQGNNFADAVKMAQDALRTAVDIYIECGGNLPATSAPRHGDVMIEVKL